MCEFKTLQVLHHAGAYARRVCGPLHEFPLRLLLLGKSSPTVDCPPLRGHQWTEAACPLSRGNLHCITAGDLCHGFVEPHLGSPLPLEGRCASLRGLQQLDQDHCSPLTRNPPTNLERTTAAQKGSWGLWLSLSQDFRMLLCLLCVLCFACPERLIDRWQKVG